MPDITLTDAVELTEARAAALPWNYLAPAFGDLIRREGGPTRIVMVLPDGDRPARYAAISADILRDPGATAGFIAALGGGQTQGYFMGPVTGGLRADAGMEVFQITGAPWAEATARVFDHAVVIIDAGIAFWNQRFRGLGGPRFRGVRYLDFDLPDQGQAGGLNEAGVEQVCSLADASGSAAVMARLAADYPASVFGAAANPDPQGFWHGTAVADLAAGAVPGEADHVALFGLELPRAVVADYSGETLTAMLAMILPAAIQMTAGFAAVPLTVVLPLGFPAGPQDGTHPAAVAIANALQMSGRTNVRVVVPAGNQLQDRCHARLGPDTGASVGWDLPPDDYSTNEVEILGPAGAPLRLQLGGPGQGLVEAGLAVPNSYRRVLCGGQEIGILMRFADVGPWSRTRLALWRTASEATGVATPHGRWTLASDGKDVLEMWAFRDDRDPTADRARPRRPSRFWSAAYRLRDEAGAQPLTDDAGSAVLRSGTLSVLATTVSPAVVVVEAAARLGGAAPVKAGYSGRPAGGAPVPMPVSVLVDDGWPDRGVAVAANGSQRRMRMSGTSAAAGLQARALIGLAAAPLL